jgi:glycosyltransferase involved in cell wall biosynthesis
MTPSPAPPASSVIGAPDGISDMAVTYRSSGARTDAILAYSHHLVQAVNGSGRMVAVLVTDDGKDAWSTASGSAADRLRGISSLAGGVLLQYNPFSYGRWGFAPWLPLDLRALRRAGIPVAVMIHEAFVGATAGRQRLLAAWQRVQLRLILEQSQLAFTSTEGLIETVRGIGVDVPIHHLPVASNLPDERLARDATRLRLGLSDDDLALVAFGTGHPSQLTKWVSRAALASKSVEARTVVLNLGAGASRLTDIEAEMRVVTPGELSAGDLAAHIAAGDVFVAPFSDGVSTRRTTVMAALQHGLPVVGTRGFATDSVLSSAPGALALVECGRLDLLENEVREAVANRGKRADMSRAARALYESRFSWDVIAGQMLDHLIPVWQASLRR